MANKKLSKLLAFAAISGAAIAAGIAYFKRKNEAELWDDDFDDLDDDFDDEDFDFPLPEEDKEDSAKREYVSLNLDKESNTEETTKIDETPKVEDAIQAASNSSDTKETIVENEQTKEV